MARIHRDGQKRPVFIYRFLTTGMIDEKIYQRQVTKQGLSDSLMDSKAAGTSFSVDELRDLFQCHESTDCLTHDMLNCPCSHDGLNEVGVDEAEDSEPEEPTWQRASQVQEPRPKPSHNIKSLREYDHISPNTESLRELLCDDALYNTMQSSHISYCFLKKTALSVP